MKRVLLVGLLLYLSLTAQDAEPDGDHRDGDHREPWTIGVALSGGAALGMAHIGILKVLEEEGIPISYISGTSMGSIVAGMYAAGYTPDEMDSILTTVDWSALFSNRIPEDRMTLARREEGHRNIVEISHRWFVPYIPSGVVSLQNVEIFLTELLSEASYDANYNFDSLAIPFRCVAADVTSGEKVVFKKGSMVDAIRASIAIPGVFSPARVKGRDLIDGGTVMNLPVEPLLELEPDSLDTRGAQHHRRGHTHHGHRDRAEPPRAAQAGVRSPLSERGPLPSLGLRARQGACGRRRGNSTRGHACY